MFLSKRLLSLLFLPLGACASHMSEQDCAQADWYQLGVTDGNQGRDLDKFAERTEQCAAYEVAMDQAAYMKGRDQGLESYCTPLGGLYSGCKGQAYKNVCPAALERDFIGPYQQGRDFYQAKSRFESAESELENTYNSIDSKRREIRRLRKKQADASDDTAYIEKLEGKINKLYYDIQDLEDSIYRKRRALDRAEDDFRDAEYEFNRYEDELRRRIDD